MNLEREVGSGYILYVLGALQCVRVGRGGGFCFCMDRDANQELRQSVMGRACKLRNSQRVVKTFSITEQGGRVPDSELWNLLRWGYGHRLESSNHNLFSHFLSPDCTSDRGAWDLGLYRKQNRGKGQRQCAPPTLAILGAGKYPSGWDLKKA